MTEAIPIDDRGLLLGDGLFETLLADQGRLAAFEAHAARLRRGCAVLGLPQPGDSALQRAAEAALAAAGLAERRAAVRITYTAGSGGRGLERPGKLIPRLFAAASPAPASAEPARLATAAVRRNSASPASRLKTLAYLDNLLARREALAAGADEALMLNTAGEVACAAAANLFWIGEGRLLTPALDCGVLDGIMRAAVIRCAGEIGIDVLEVRASLDEVLAAEALFLSNSLIGLRPVQGLDGRPFAPHPLIERLRAGVRRQGLLGEGRA